ncbi:DNA internalization-related competence protein ComEC/Rec2 [Planctobacterium marinum]|uniref:DNA internalization-related competence protein ComEC/Rec2 n=2 Tax=Planctobacterium marinum TaxID=1631968 RepID=A0AA48KSW8_9ALTE|nr:DNA internalization-related competence protein ComEC/Rec2 [Planctobacterium marinum]
MLSVGYWISVTQPEQALFLQPLQLSGRVGTVVTSSEKANFNFVVSAYSLSQDDNIEAFIKSDFKVRLSWLMPDLQLKQGQQLTIVAKLKPRWGLYNEAGFNYQQWLLSEHIVATGFVKSATESNLPSAVSWRQRVADKLITESRKEVRWLLAMAIGYRGELSQSDWQLLQHTGTSHLVAISGMHVGMVTFWAFCLFSLLFGALNFVTRRPVISNIRIAAFSISLCFAFFYVYLAGFATPTVRAGLMLLLGWAVLVLGVNLNVRRFILICVALFILFFPLSIFTASFWLSFSAVVILWFIAWRSRKPDNKLPNKLAAFVALQIMLSALMLTLVLGMFGGVSVLSPVINLIAIPLVIFVLLPLSLLSVILLMSDSSIASHVLEGCLTLFALCEQGLKSITTIYDQWLQASAIPWLALVFATLAMILLLIPRGLFPKPLVILLFVPLLLPQNKRETNGWQLDMLDVGHGLAVLLRKQNSAVLYDVAAEFPDGFSMAENVLLPVLRSSGISQLDTVIISHDDIDHVGGLDTILRHQSVLEMRYPKQSCQRGDSWHWQGIQFEVLWPDLNYPKLLHNDNNQSCVIMLDDGSNRILLTGDIEQDVELLLATWHRSGLVNLSAQVLIAAHHGSKTSSSSPFILAVDPHYVLISAGHYNRWGMPAEIVMKRLRKLNTAICNTAEHGQISVIIDEYGKLSLKSWRKDVQPRWFLSL